ncbi:hypothetical protein RhiJN_17467 [Ceratobasidium sp. AG-Ba]|nr:hypothetical protein RhiJN_17467 [Ceratobasidium sp. AG-Ba]
MGTVPSELTNLIPRMTVLTIILTVYLRLHLLLRHRRRDVRNSQHTISIEGKEGELPELANEPDATPRQSGSLDDIPVPLTLPQTTGYNQSPAQGSSPGSHEQIPENIVDFINRKARMLILLFPLS